MVASAIALFAAVAPALAEDGEYTVELCSDDGEAPLLSDGIFSGLDGEPNPNPFEMTAICHPGPGRAILQGKADPFVRSSKDDGIRWTLVTPPDTRIVTLEMKRTFLVNGRHSFLKWVLFTTRGRQLDAYIDDGRPTPNAEARKYTVNDQGVVSLIFCETTLCPGAGTDPGGFFMQFEDPVAVVIDERAPVVTPPVLTSAELSGTARVGVSVNDPGAGLAEVALVVDGEKKVVIHDGNGGRCQKPYRFVKPCVSEFATPVELDTRQLAEGRHLLKVTATDATGRETSSGSVEFTVRNAPGNFAPPAVFGSAQVGARLLADPGGWVGESPAFSYQWLRCPIQPGHCAVIAGANGAEYTASAADRGSRAAVLVTATNSKGTAQAISTATDVIDDGLGGGGKPKDTKAPLLTKVTLSNKRLLLSGGVKAASTRLGLSSDEAGKLTIVISRSQGKKRKRVITLVATIKRGRSVVPLGTTLGDKTLAPGGYEVAITVRDAAGNLSKPARKPFRVAR